MTREQIREEAEKLWSEVYSPWKKEHYLPIIESFAIRVHNAAIEAAAYESEYKFLDTVIAESIRALKLGEK